ncbi:MULTISPECIES: c-type cytochrome [unclassified Sphingomonas]|uniref:c-type cytochrome n=1 Tax=unclassified Sphingomonas TaxID=196159 RepID=UPI001835FBF7|nr:MULTISPECIES: cytochrome c [unclassified Sphingomonas]MBB3346751.1 mono/diheme cytochrome c family protein [Sphingomonas sp. BK069]MBB3472869.1 mono/diheme cytochrome c family protein [Sphingomonas sp. BK345]
MMERTTRYGLWALGAAALAFGSAVVVRAQGGQRDVWNGVYTAEQAARGKVAYAENCAACHGDTLAGIDVAPALVGGGFLNNWNGTSAGDLFSRIKTTMPLSAPGSLPGKTVADIQAYIFEVNGFPAGKLPLPPSQPMAAGIVIAPKPVG